MALSHYQLFLADTFKLVRSIVIKSEMIIALNNRYLSNFGINIDLSDPTTWKYYRNISGEYFINENAPYVSDKIMTVVSLDTQEEIIFSKENLVVHRATAVAYQYGSSYFKELVNRFPLQIDLILGILNPVNIYAAIEASDGEILNFDKTLVEENETNLIPKLQEWIQFMLRRWYVKDYAFTDEDYGTFVIADLYAQMTNVILNIRLDNCKTDFVHSYHIREYLASNGKLDRYLEQMTKKQALFFYRNIKYLNKNAGKQETFDLLVQKVLTDRGIPLNAFSIRYNTANLTTDLKPGIEFIKQPLNFDLREGRNELYSVEYVVDKEVPLARFNGDIVTEAIAETIEKARIAPFSEIPTKVLESTVIDTSEKGPFLLSMVLLNNWAYYSAKNLYRSAITVTYPNTGENITLNAKDAFTLFLYVYYKSIDVNLETVPVFPAIWVQRDPQPSLTELMSIAPSNLLNEGFYEFLLGEEIPLEEVISVVGFNEHCVALHKELQERYSYVSSIEHAVTRTYALNALQSLYGMAMCTLETEGTEYDDWLFNKGINLIGFSSFDYQFLAEQLYIAGLGIDPKRISALEELHNAMLGIMQQLSSYSIQFIKTTITDPAIRLDNPAMRVGDVESIGYANFKADFSPYPIVRVESKSTTLVDHDNSVEIIQNPPTVKASVNVDYDPSVKIGLSVKRTERIRMMMTHFDIVKINGVPFSFTNVIPETQLNEIPLPDRLGALVLNNNLNGFTD